MDLMLTLDDVPNSYFILGEDRDDNWFHDSLIWLLRIRPGREFVADMKAVAANNAIDLYCGCFVLLSRDNLNNRADDNCRLRC